MSLKNPPSLGEGQAEKKYFDQVTRQINLCYRLKVVSVTAAYSAKIDDGVVLADATGGAFTVTLPSATGSAGAVLRIKRLNSGANAVTVSGAGGQTIDGAATSSLTTQYQVLSLVSDGANWQKL